MIIEDSEGACCFNVFHITRISYVKSESAVYFELLNGQTVCFSDRTVDDFNKYLDEWQRLRSELHVFRRRGV